MKCFGALLSHPRAQKDPSVNTVLYTYYRVSWLGTEEPQEFHGPNPELSLQEARGFATYSLQASGFKDIQILKVTTEIVEIVNRSSLSEA